MTPSFTFELIRSGAGTPDPLRGWRVARTCDGGACVEVGNGESAVAVRDNALPQSPVLAFTPGAWERFTSALKAS
jgi:hypothetical protein